MQTTPTIAKVHGASDVETIVDREGSENHPAATWRLERQAVASQNSEFRLFSLFTACFNAMGFLFDVVVQLSSRTGVTEVGAAISLLSCFPAGSHEAGRAAHSLCGIVGSSTHLTPGPALKETLKHSYYRSAAASSLQTDWTQANFVGAWQFVREGVERKAREWGKVGVVADDILELIKRARREGNKLSRFEKPVKRVTTQSISISVSYMYIGRSTLNS